MPLVFWTYYVRSYGSATGLNCDYQIWCSSSILKCNGKPQKLWKRKPLSLCRVTSKIKLFRLWLQNVRMSLLDFYIFYKYFVQGSVPNTKSNLFRLWQFQNCAVDQLDWDYLVNTSNVWHCYASSTLNKGLHNLLQNVNGPMDLQSLCVRLPAICLLQCNGL